MPENRIESPKTMVSDNDAELVGGLSPAEFSLSETESQLSIKELRLKEASQNLSRYAYMNTKLQDENNGLQKELTYLQKESNITVRKVSTATAMDFIINDTTDKNLYIKGEYICWNFTADFIANARFQGIDSVMVLIMFENDTCHSIAAIDTLDGWIFVEPQTDKIVSLSQGDKMLGQTIKDWTIIG